MIIKMTKLAVEFCNKLSIWPTVHTGVQYSGQNDTQERHFCRCNRFVCVSCFVIVVVVIFEDSWIYGAQKHI